VQVSPEYSRSSKWHRVASSGISWIEFRMSSRLKIGQVDWHFSRVPLERTNASSATVLSIKSHPALDAALGTRHRSGGSWASGPGCQSAV
jgi:hypothetical protein